MGVSGDDMRIGAIMLGCPTAVATYVMASQLEGDTDLAGTIVVFSSIASLFSVTAWLYFLRATMSRKYSDQPPVIGPPYLQDVSTFIN